MAKRPSFLLYSNSEVPPPLSIAILAVQHSAIVLINLVYVVIMAKSLNLSAVDQFAMLSTTLLVCGAASLLQAKFGSGMFIVFHPNPIFIPLVIAAGLSSGAAGIATLVVTAGVVQFAFGSAVKKLRVFFPPEVCGVVVIMLGVSLLPGTLRGIVVQSFEKSFAHVDTQGLIVAVITLAVASAGSVWLKGMARFFSLLLGCLAGLVVAYFTGLWHMGANVQGLNVAPVSFPDLRLPGFHFDLGLIYLAAVAALVNVVDELGVLIGTERLDDADWRRPNFNKISLGLQSSGVFTALSGLMGGVALGMSSANLSLAYATGVTSRVLAMAVGVVLMAVAFVPAALEHVLSLPDAVVAGLLFYAACYFIVSGAELALSRMLSPRRSLVIGLSVGAGVLLQSVPTLTTRFAGSSFEHVLAPMTFATILAIVLNLLMRIGIGQKETMSFTGSEDSARTNDILEELGERWGLHRATGARVAAAMSETLELLGTTAEGPIDCTIEYNELFLNLNFTYRGLPMPLPDSRPDAEDLLEHEDGVMRMSGWIIKKLSDKTATFTTGDRQEVKMAFEC
ncbi:solute carrier family 23 protein [Aestuariivirga sp.]|uniref:solute carrier family 23 protein n=1 Tax=Aestuariivirga sp. TaxID=2650926 RepID=UPI003BA8D39C